MLQLVVRRLLAMIPLLFLVSLIVFSLVLLIPGDPAITISGENATEAQIEATRDRLGLNDPVIVQYGRWAANAVQGDLGTSLFSSRTVAGAIAERFPVTLALTGAALVVALLVAIPAGILASVNRGRWPDRVATLGASLGVAMPNFWLGLMLVLVFAIWNPWFPAVGYVPFTEDPVGWLRHITLPAITLGVSAAAETTRQLRSALSDVLHQDYIRTARAKGLRSKKVVIKHGLKNAAVPVITVVGLQTALLLGGSVVVERVFGIPGLGDLAIRAVLERDIPMIQGVVVFTTITVLVVNLLVDISYGYLNPKVRGQ